MINDIYQLELSLLDDSMRQSFVQIDTLISDDFLEFGSSGIIYHKKDLLHAIPLENIGAFNIENFQTRKLSENTILVTYIMHIESGTFLRSSIWQYRCRQWQMVFHQGTKCLENP